MKPVVLLLSASLLSATSALGASATDVEIRQTFLAQQATEMAQRARYPEWSEALAADAADPLAERADPRSSAATTSQDGVRLRVWPSALVVQAGERFAILAELTPDATAGLDVRALGALQAARISVQLQPEGGAQRVALHLNDAGLGVDQRSGDGLWAIEWTAPAALEPAPGQSMVIDFTVRADLSDGRALTLGRSVLVSHPTAVLTGQFRQLYRNGNLVLEAEADVRHPGRLHLAGTLADALGRPLGTAQAGIKPARLGRQWLELSWYGLIFHDRQVRGRLQLASLSLTSVEHFPGAPAPLLRHAWWTEDLQLAALTRQPFQQADKLELAASANAGLAR